VAERVEPLHEAQGRRLAAIDLGTNSVRLLVAELDEHSGLLELARDMVITRIGSGVDRTRRIAAEALDRTVAVLEPYGRRARALHAERIRVAATSAVRDAENRADLEQAVRRIANSDLEVLSGEEEAALSFLGATDGLEEPAPYLVVDIGGGSTELAFGERESEATISLQIGSVRLTERFVRSDPPTSQELAAIREAVDGALGAVDARVPVREAKTLVAVAGTATTTQAVVMDLSVHDPDVVHRSSLSIDEAHRTMGRLAGMTVAERAALPVMPPGREDVIVAGTAILERIMTRWNFQKAVISESDILDGLVLQLAPSR
jgi:exopolyphosphatase/guanosine-5'-triphosphate,3'-diphosphate pyrophosphatase